MAHPDRAPKGKAIVGGPTIKEYVPDPVSHQYPLLEGWDTDLMTPLGTILNFLRERDGSIAMKTRYPADAEANANAIRFDKLRAANPTAFLEEYQSSVEKGALADLKKAVETITGSDEAAQQVSLEKIESAWKHVEGGGRVARALAKRIVLEFTALQSGRPGPGGELGKDAEIAADALSKDERFMSLITSVGDRLYTITERQPGELAHIGSEILNVARDTLTHLQNKKLSVRTMD